MQGFKNYTIKKQLTFEELCESIATDINKYGDVAIGSDIEMLWLAYLGPESRRKYEFFRADSIFCHSGSCGTDGRTIISELRMTPAYDPLVFVQSMEEVLKVCHSHLQRRINRDSTLSDVAPYGMNVYHIIDKYGIDLPESIGTHIHFGYNVNSFDSTTRNYINRVIIQAMDAFIMPITKCFEPNIGHHIRTKCGYYGDLSEYREKPYGIEYKSLPCILDNKVVFAGIFALAKAIAFEVLTGNLHEEDVSEFRISRDNINNVNYLKRYIARAKYFLKNNCRFYTVYRPTIEAMFKLVLSKNPKEVFENEVDILNAWGITPDSSFPEYYDNLEYGMFFPLDIPISGYDGEFGSAISNIHVDGHMYVRHYE